MNDLAGLLFGGWTDGPAAARLGSAGVMLAIAACAVYRQEAIGFVDPQPETAARTSADGEGPLLSGTVVAETGVPVAGARVTASTDDGTRVDGLTDQYGAFSLRLPATFGDCGVIVVDGSKTRIWAGRVDRTGGTESGDLRIVLPTAHEVAVEVVDRDGRPVAGATVVALEQQYEVATARTANTGTASLRLPGNTSTVSIHAFKSGAGYDCVLNGRIDGRNQLVGGAPISVPERIRLRLTGAKPVRVEVVDSYDRPVPGVALAPYMLHRAGDSVFEELSHAASFAVTTGADGAAVFDWLPNDLEEAVQLASRSPEFWWDRRMFVGDARREARFRLLRRTKLAGRVLTPDGAPSAGARIDIRGTPSSYDFRFQGSTTAGRDGRFEMLVAPEREYTVAAEHNGGVAMLSEIMVNEKSPIANLELRLEPAFLVTGRILSGDGSTPIAGERVSLHTSPRERRPVDLTRHTTTDARGQYRFLVGRGRHFVWANSDGRHVVVSGDSPQTAVEDMSLPGAEESVFVGRVIDSQGEPVPGADVLAYYAGHTGHVQGFRLLTDRNGIFTVARQALPMIIRLTTSDGKLAAVVNVDGDQQAGTFEPLPPLAVRGRLLDGFGTPMPGARIYYYVHVPAQIRFGPVVEAGFQARFDGTVMTDEAGRYELPDLAPGARWSIGYRAEARSHWRTLRDVNLFVEGRGEIDLGDTPLPKPLRPPDVRETINAEFHLGEPLAGRMAAATEQSQRGGRPILIYLGDPASDFSWKLKSALENRSNAKLFGAASQLPQLWVKAANAEAADKALGELGVVAKNVAPPAILLVNTNGNVLDKLPLGKDADGMIDAPPLANMLLRHVPADDAAAPAGDGKPQPSPKRTEQGEDSTASTAPADEPKPATDAPAAGAANQKPAKVRGPWSVRGKITDGEGQPLAGVKVTAHTGMGSLRLTGTADSDVEGKYEFAFGPGFMFEDDAVIP